MRKLVLLSVALMVVLAGCGSITGTPAPEATDGPVETPVDGTPTEAPIETPDQLPEGDEDTPGYVNGIWYNQSLDIDASDGLSDEELEQLKFRTMARLEVLRGLQFKEDVPVEILTREEFQEELDESGSFDVTESERIHQNVKWEAPFLVDQQTDAVDVFQAFYGGAVLGYYDSQANEIVVISPEGEDGVPDGLDEMTLAHELGHALQDQHFNLSDPKFRGVTTEENNAINGLVEGDVHYFEVLYEQRCMDGEWDCLERPDRGAGGDFHVGVWAVQYAPYSEGPSLVKDIHEADGWDAVNEMYDNPPASTSQIIHHEKYPDETPAEVTIEDRSSEDWHVPEVQSGVQYAVFGEAALYVMFWYPSFVESQAAGAPVNVIIDYDDFFNLAGPGGDLDPFHPYDYSHEITEGWNGDILLPYANDAGETGYVWKFEWDSPEDATQFVDAYAALLEHHGASEVEPGTYLIDEGGEFEGAFSVSQDGTSVVIVNAPSVDELGDVHEPADA